VVAMASAALLLHQIPTVAEAAGGVLLVTGVLVTGLRLRRRVQRLPPGAEFRLSAPTADPDPQISAETVGRQPRSA
jgi:O-acetylserine/cysteine efflux transporter